MINHAGNAANQMNFEEHDGANNAKRVTIGAVSVALPVTFSGNITATMPGGVTVFQGSTPWNSLGTTTQNGLITLAPSPNFIGLTTTQLGAGDRFIGLATVVHAGNVTLNASAAYIGLASVNVADAKAYIGLTTTTLGVGDRFIGLTTVVHAGNVTLNASAAFIGLATVNIGANPNTFIGLATVVIGNASVATKNAGTTKTLKILPIRLSTNSNSSIAITNTFYVTSILLNSNATVRLNILSGVTYLTGNVSLGINIFPGGGWVETGSVDSPIYIGQAGAAPINFEKFDAAGTISQVAGKIVYFDE